MAFGAKIKLSVNTSGASAFRNEIQKHVNNATASNPIKIKNVVVEISNPKTQIANIQKQFNANGGIVVKLKEVDASGAIKKLRSDIQQMLTGLNIVGLKDFLGSDNVDEVANGIERSKQAATEWASQMRVINDIQSKLGSTYKSALSGNNMISDTAKLTEITSAYTRWQQQIESLKATRVALSAAELSALQQEGIALQQNITLIQREQVEQKKAAATAEATFRKELSLSQQTISLKSQIQRYILSNSKAYKVYGNDLDALMHILQNESDLTTEKLKQIRMQFVNIQTSAKVAGVAGNTFWDTMKKGWEKFGGWSLVTRSMMSAYRVIKDMVTAVKELDTAMTELKKVTDLSEQSYKNYLNTAIEMSQRVGATLTDTVNATADFSRLGYDIADSTALAEAALVYKNVGDGIEDISEASESLISTIKAFEQFGVTAENAMDIVDKFNEVGNNFAISSEGIGVALQKSASSLASANNTLEESIALITGMNSVIQNPEIVGTALKTVSMYLRAAKTEAEEAGESTDGMANSVSELREELLTLTGGKVDIMIDDSTFKSTYQIMKELSEVWNELSDVDTANILELIGGKRNATAVTSLLTNFKDAEAALISANEAAGSATAENEKYLDSISGKLSTLQAKFETLSNHLIDSSVIKFFIDLGSGLITILDTLQQLNILLPMISASVAVIMGYMNANKISSITQQILLQKNGLLSGKDASDQLALSLTALNTKQRELLLTQLENAVTTGTLTAEQKAQIVSTLGLSTATSGAAKANLGLAASFKTLMASIPVWGWIALAITVVIEAITALTSAFNENKQAAIDHANEVIDAYDNAKETYDSNAQSLESMRAEFEKLSRGVDENGNNISLTANEYETYLSLIQQIIDISPDICLGYDNEGKAILNYKTALDDAIASQETYMQNQRNIYLGQGEDIFDGKTSEYEDAVKELGNAAGANDLSDKSLDDALNPGFWDSIFNADEAQAKLDAYKDAFEQLGIKWQTGVDTWRDSTDSVMQMYEHADEIMVILRNSGAYTEDELIKIEERLHGLAGAYTKINNIEQAQVNYLSEWSKDQNWYANIPFSALDEFIDGLKEVNDPLKGYNENIQAASQYGSEFSSALSSDSVKGILDMATGLSDGSVSLEEYNSAMSDFKSSFDGSEAVLNSLVSYFEELSNSALDSADATASYTKSLSDLSDTIDNLEKAYDILETAKTEMENGGLSSDTVQSIIDLMDEGENYLDYLEFENGQILLNTKAWQERASATMLGDLSEIEKETESLIKQNQALEEKIKYAEEQQSLGYDDGTWASQIEEYTQKIEENSEKIKENQGLLGMYGAIYDSIANNLFNVLDFSDMVSDLGDIESNVQSLISAMDTLAGGTALTKKELVDLALEYPKLLEASNLFTDGSIAGQQSMLENILQVYENEYDATIDAKIAELEATNTAFENAITMEQEKANILSEIKAEEVNNNATYAAWLAEQLAKYNDIEGQNYVSYQDGVLQVTEDAMNAILQQESEKAQLSAENIWQPQATTIANSYAEGGSAGLSALNTVGQRIAGWIQGVKNKFLSLARTIANALMGKESDDGSGTTDISTYIDTDVGDVKFTGGTVTINGQTLDEWTNTQTEITAARIDALRSQINTNLTAIDNLRKLKGLDLTTIYGPKDGLGTGSGSKSSKKEVEEYIADIDKYYAAVKKLEEIQQKREYLEKKSKYINDPLEKIENERALMELYKQEADAERELMNLKSQTIEANAAALRALGFQVEYNSDTNELFIKNLEHLNELTASSKGEYDSLQEATNALRKETEELIDVTEDLNDENVKSAENIEDLTFDILDAKNNIVDYIEEIYDKQVEAYKEIIELRKEAIQSAKDEYDYESDVADKVKEIADLQARIDKLSLDDSREAQAERNSLMAELAEKNKELANTQGDHAYDAQIDALDELAEAYEAEKSTELEILQNTVTTVDEVWDLFYNSILGKNVSVGKSINEEVANAWLNAAEAVKDYSGAVAGVTGVGAIVGNVPKYHTGGVVGSGNSSKKEILALLESGEIVLNDNKQDSLYEVIDFQTELSKRLGVAIGSLGLQTTPVRAFSNIDNVAPNVSDVTSSVVFNPQIEVQINHSGNMNDNDAKRYGEQIANTAIEKLYGAFERKGINGNISTKLKP